MFHSLSKKGRPVQFLAHPAVKDNAARTVRGLDQPTSGSVRLNGVALGDISEDERARVRNQHVGFVFRISTNSDADALGTSRPDGIARRPLRADSWARNYSGALGWATARRTTRRNFRRRAATRRLARAFINRPSILFADEPTGKSRFRNERKNNRDHVGIARARRHDARSCYPRSRGGRIN
jgi:hypothetical protein